MSETLSKIPGGMRYHFGAEARLRRSIEDRVMAVFDGWSYEEIAAPAVDYYALFERGMGHDEAHRAFRFTDTDGRMLALRPDVTSSVARAAATLFAGRVRPLRFCYAASVFRQRPRSHAEWRRQSRQLGCELIGAAGREADAEVLLIAVEVLEQLGLGSAYRITLNHAGVFNGLAERLALGAEARERMRRLIDTRDAAGLEQFLAPHESSRARPELAGRLTRLSGKRQVLAEARRMMDGERSIAALDALEKLWGVIEESGLSEQFELDLGDVSGPDYYTGLVFKIYVEGAGFRVGGGGRYDELTANFGLWEPAVGFVLDLDSLAEVLAGRRDEAEPAKEAEHAAREVLNTAAGELFGEARRLRAQGERVRLRIEE